MDRESKRLLLLVVSCSITGVVLGGTAGWAESNSCLDATQVTSNCLTQNTAQQTIQGMGTGLLAGAGAAFGVMFNLRY
jgi:hypothetical protein